MRQDARVSVCWPLRAEGALQPPSTCHSLLQAPRPWLPPSSFLWEHPLVSCPSLAIQQVNPVAREGGGQMTRSRRQSTGQARAAIQQAPLPLLLGPLVKVRRPLPCVALRQLPAPLRAGPTEPQCHALGGGHLDSAVRLSLLPILVTC